jgi:hypothetical protein
VESSSPVTLALPATAPVTGVHPKLHETQQNIYGFLRFFTRISNMQVVFKETLQKSKNDANKVSKSKHEITIQYELKQTS